MSGLDIAALVVIFVLICLVATIVVVLGSLPAKIARKRGHPCPDAVNAASWIGMAAGGLLWPVAFVWAFLPVPARVAAAPGDGAAGADQLAALRARVEALEAASAGAGPRADAAGSASC